MILRLSWDCGKKFAVIPTKNNFELVGVHRNYIPAELEFLQKNKVIVIIPDMNIYALNKDYDQWTIPYKKKFNEQKIKDLLSINLAQTQQNVDSINKMLNSYMQQNVDSVHKILIENQQNVEPINKMLHEKTQQNIDPCNKMLINDAIKCCIPEPETPDGTRADGVPKESIKIINNNIINDCKREVIDYYCEKMGKLALSEKDRMKLDEVLTIPGITADIIKKGIDIGFQRFTPSYQGHRINGFGYFVSPIRELMADKGPPSGSNDPISQKKIVDMHGYQVEINLATGACTIGGTTYMSEDTCRAAMERKAFMEGRICS